MNTSPPPPLLALPVPVYRKRAKSKTNKMKKTVPALNPASDEREAASIDADPPISHAGIRSPRPEPLFSRYWNTSVHSIERAAAKRKMKRVRVLSGDDFDSICKLGFRRRGSELLPFLGKGSKRKKRKTVSVLSPVIRSCIKRGRSELLFSRKGGDKIRVRSKWKTRTVTDAVPIWDISVRRRRSELPRLKKRVWGVDWMVMAVAEMEGEEDDPARSICARHKVKKDFATAPAALGFAEAMGGERGEALGISQQMHVINMTVGSNIMTGRAKKKVKKHDEMVKMMTGEENTKEEGNPSCSNGGISRQSLESFANMVKAFRYAGNRGGIESDGASTSANVAFSTTFKGEKASCNCTRATNGTLEEIGNNIPETTPRIATTSFRTLNHNKRITSFENSNTVVAVNPSLVSGQQDEAPWVLPASVSKKMRRKHKEAAVHAPCPVLAHEPASQKTKKQRKMASSPTTDEVGKVRKSVRCKHREAMTKAEKMQDSYRRVSPDNNWVPQNSPYELLQEDHAFDPWRVLVICMLLNQTTGEQVKKILRRVFLLCPTAEAAIQVPMNELRTIIESLGLQNKRVRDIREMSRQYLKDGWTYVTELHGIGKYAADAYAIFCVGKPEDIVPDDHMLVKYWEYVVQWKREQYRLAVG